MIYLGDITLGETVETSFTTVSALGVPTALTSGVLSAYIGSSTTQLTAGITLTANWDGVTGLNHVTVVCTAANGYTSGSTVQLVVTTGTIAGVSAVGYVVAEFTIDSLLGRAAAGLSTGGDGSRCITASDLVTRACRLIGFLDAVEVLAPEDLDTGFEALNDLIDSWATQRLASPTLLRSTWTIVSGTASYTVGDGGTVNIIRPLFIPRIHFVDTSLDPDREYPLTQLTDEGYAALTQRAFTSTYPTAAYYTNDAATLGRIYFYPVPTSSTLQGVIYGQQSTPYFADTSTEVCFRPGYVRALRYNLAVELAPEFGIEPSADVRRMAATSLADLKRANIKLTDLPIDPALAPKRRGYSIYSGA